MFWALPAGTESCANPVLEEENRKPLKDVRRAVKDSHPFSQDNTNTGKLPAKQCTYLSPGKSYCKFFHFHKNRDFFSPTPGDADPKLIPLKQPHDSLHSNWHVFLCPGINHTGLSNPGSWQATAVATKLPPRPVGDLKEQQPLAHPYVNCWHSWRSLAAVGAALGPCSMLGDQLLHLQHHMEKGKANIAAI